MAKAKGRERMMHASNTSMIWIPGCLMAMVIFASFIPMVEPFHLLPAQRHHHQQQRPISIASTPLSTDRATGGVMYALGQGGNGGGQEPPKDNWWKWWGRGGDDDGEREGEGSRGLPLLMGLSAVVAYSPSAFMSRNWPPRCLEIIAPNSTVLDQATLDHVIEALGIWGARLDKSKLKTVIATIDRYYMQRGYFGCSIRTAYAHDNGSVVLDVIEPRVADEPVVLTYIRPMNNDTTINSSKVSKKKHKALPAPAATPVISEGKKKNSPWFKGDNKKSNSGTKELATISSSSSTSSSTALLKPSPPPPRIINLPDLPPHVTSKGRTKPKVVAEALGLRRNQVFRLDRERFRRLERMGPFDLVRLKLIQHDKDGKLGVELIVRETPSRVIEPGLSKSLHTRDWTSDVYFQDLNLFGLNQGLTLKVCKGLIRSRKEPCLTVAAQLTDNPLKHGVLRSFSLYRDPVASDSVREGGLARFNLPLLGPIRTAIEFTADRLTNQTRNTLGATVTAIGSDVGVAIGLLGGRQEADLSVSTGVCFGGRGIPSLSLSGGEPFTKIQAVGTATHNLIGNLYLATRNLAYWASDNVPSYLAYRMGGRFYVRGFDDPDFVPFASLAGGTAEFRLPLMNAASGRVGVTACAFVDYATGVALDEEDDFLLSPPKKQSRRSKRSKSSVLRHDYASGGLGLRAGPVKIDWAVNHRGEGKVHISLVDPTF